MLKASLSYLVVETLFSNLMPLLGGLANYAGKIAIVVKGAMTIINSNCSNSSSDSTL
jgi:hypothetical protein